MTQTAGAGKLTTENWNQLTDAIPGAAGRLQESMLKAGAYTGNFRDAMEKGEITADEFSAAIMDLGMSDVAKEAATSTSTMEGAMGNLEAAVVGGLTDAFNLFKPTVTSAMSVAADKISAFSGKATTGLQGVIKLVRDGDFSSELREAFNIDEDSPVVDFLLTIRDNAVSAFDTAKQKAGEFVAAFQNTGPMQAAADIFGAVWEACKNLAARPVTSSASSRRWRILWAARPAPARRWVTHSTALPISSAWFRTSSRRSATGYPSMRNPSRPRLWASRRVSPRSRSLRPSAPSCPRCRDSAWRPRPLLWRSGHERGHEREPIVIVITAIAALVAALVYFFTQTETGRQIWASFTSWLGSCVGNIVGFFQALPGKIGGFFQSAAQFATDKWDAVVAWFKGIPGRITGAIGNVGHLLYNAGASIISGFLDGLKSMWDSVTGWISGIGDWITEHKGPPEYDAVMLVNNGRLIMQASPRACAAVSTPTCGAPSHGSTTVWEGSAWTPA